MSKPTISFSAQTESLVRKAAYAIVVTALGGVLYLGYSVYTSFVFEITRANTQMQQEVQWLRSQLKLAQAKVGSTGARIEAARQRAQVSVDKPAVK